MSRNRNSLGARILACAMSVVLAVGLMPLPAFAETASGGKLTIGVLADGGQLAAGASANDGAGGIVLGAQSSGVSYIERSWSGENTSGSVTETTRYRSSYSTLSSNTSNNSTSLGGGWYVLSSDVTYSKCLQVTGDAKVILCDGKTLTANDGIYIQDGCTLTVYGQSGDSGKISASSEDNAGIGGKKKVKGGNLVVHGGSISAQGDTNAAGIGGGNKSASGFGDVTIYGGTIDATGGSSGAGIGKGQQNDTFGTVRIYGGTVNASSTKYGAGIGGGEDRGGVTTEIYGGTVTATGGKDGAGIGGGESGDGGNVTVYGGTVNASSEAYGAGIGGGENGGGGALTVEGGTVTATGGSYGAGIGGGKDGDGGTLTIKGGTVTATGGTSGAGIGCGMDGKGGTVSIDNATVTATGGKGGPGIGGEGDSSNPVSVTIKGGTVEAQGKNKKYSISGPGIGVMNEDGILNFNMTGGNVTATSTGESGDSGAGGAGVGGRDCKNVELHVTISGGKLTANGGPFAAGIGAGSCYGICFPVGANVTSKSEIRITGGTVNATGGDMAAGIGSGRGGNQQGTIIIEGGTVNAKGGRHNNDHDNGAAGIGGGAEVSASDIGGNAGTIKILGGTVYAEAGYYHAHAIGHGGGDENDGDRTIGDSVMVSHNSNFSSAYSASNRMEGFNNNDHVYTKECTHPDNTYTSTDSTHKQSCSYCKTSFSAEPHSEDDQNKCTVCGYQGALCTLSFDANGGSGTMDSVTAVPGRDYTLPEPGFTAPEGRAFEAWTVVIGGNNMGDILPGDTITVPTATSDIAGTATAKWSNKCVIKFKAGDEGASGSMDDELVETGGEYTLPKCGFTAPDGKIFKEWSVANVGGSGSAESKNPGDTITVDTHKAVTAVWADKATVTLDPGSTAVSGSTVSGDMLKDGKYTLPTYQECGFAPPEGWTFEGWSVKVGDGDAVSKQAGETIAVSADTTCTATWTSDWSALQGLLSAGGEVVLEKDYTAAEGDSPLTVSSGAAVTLDLNGHTLDGSGCSSDLLVVENGGSLTLEDGGGSGELRYEADGSGEFHVVKVQAGGNFTMNDGEISGSGTACYGVYVAGNGAKFTMTGGRVSCRGTTCYGVYVNNWASFAMSGGKVRSTKSGTKSSAYGVYVHADAGFSIEGNPKISSSQYGVYLGTDSKITLSNSLSDGVLLNVKAERVGSDHVITSGLKGKGTADNFELYDSTSNYAIGLNGSGEAFIGEKKEVKFEKGDAGASGTMDTVYVAEDSAYTLPECGFTAAEGKTFKEWSVKVGHRSETMQPGDAFPVSSDTTVKAVWADAYDVALDPGEGYGVPIEERVVLGSTYTLPTCEDCGFGAPESSLFKEWSVRLGGSRAVSKQPGDEIPVLDDVTATAVWERHDHSFTYAVDPGDPATIVATCGKEVCCLPDHKATLTIGVPADLTYDGTAKEAVLSGDTGEFDLPAIAYAKGGEALAGAPADVGSYVASITLGEGEGAATASVGYTIGKAAAVEIADVDVVHYFSPTDRTVSASVAGRMPADAGTLGYGIAGDATTTGSGTLVVSDLKVDGEGSVSAMLSGGEEGDTATLPVTITSANYEDSAANVVVTVTRKGDAGASISNPGGGGIPSPLIEKTYGDGDFGLEGLVTSPGENGRWTWESDDEDVVGVKSGAGNASATLEVKKASAVPVTVSAKYESDTTIGVAAVIVVVAQRQVGLDWTNTALTFNGTAQAPTATATNTVGGDEIGVTVTGGQTDAGTYTAVASGLTGSKAGSYKLPADITKSFTISKAAPVTIGDVRLTHYFNTQDRTVSASVAGKMPGDAGALGYEIAGNATTTGSGTLAVSGLTVDGEGSVSATLSGGSHGDTATLPVRISSRNYEGSTANVVVTVSTKQDAGVSVSCEGEAVSSLEKTYGDPDFTLNASAALPGSGTANWVWTSGDESVIQIIGGANSAAPTLRILKAGSVAVPVTAAYDSGDSSGGTFGMATVEVTVDPAPVELTARSGTETYDGAEKKVEGFACSVDSLKFSGVSAAGRGTDAGEYAVTFSGLTVGETRDDTGNHVVSSATNGKLTIGPKAVNASATLTDDDPITYDGTAKEPAVTARDGGTVIDPSEYTAVYSNNVNAGTASISLEDNDGGNYIVSGNTDFTIEKAAAVDIADVEQSLLIEGAEQSVAASVAGKMPEDAGELGYSPGTPQATGSAKVSGFAVDRNGDVTATITGAEAGDVVTLPVTVSSANYEDSTARVVVTLVGDAQVSIEGAAALTKTYGDADFTLNASAALPGTNGKWAWESSDESVVEITSNADASALTLRVKKASASPVTVTASYESDTTVGQAAVAVTVNPKGVTLTANSATKTYDGKEQSVEGFTSSVSGLTFSGVSAGGKGTNAGTYDATFSGVAVNSTRDTTGNYVVAATVDGTLTISPASVGIPTAVTGLVYNGKEQTGVAEGDGYTVAGGKATNAGSYTATASLTDKANYAWSDGTTEDKKIEWSIAEADTGSSSNGDTGSNADPGSNSNSNADSSSTGTTDISSATVTGVKDKTYTGKKVTQSPTVKLNGAKLKKGTDYKLTYKNNKNAGKATMKITGIGSYKNSITKTFKIKKAAQKFKSVSPLKKSYKASALKKAAKSFKLKAKLKKGKGKVTFKKVSGSKDVTVTKAGKVKVKKGTYKKGAKLTVKVKATAAKTKNYKKKTVTKKVTITIK